MGEPGGQPSAGEVDARIIIETGIAAPSTFTLLERKGFGHPDTLADHLAEELSRTYSRWTLAHVGAVLHHNFDKLALLGGASDVWYGGGRVLDPVRVLVNGRVTRQCGSIAVPVDDLITATVCSFFARRLPELARHLVVELNVTSNSSPGAVLDGAALPERAAWFAPASVDELRERRLGLIANDTSLGTGWAPDNEVEVFARSLVDRLSGPSKFTASRPWCGSDVKLMVLADGERLDAVLCVPQKSEHVPNRAAYLANGEEVLEECCRLATDALPDLKASFRLNARDIVERDELYLTYTGSSIESGDEGLVGRGNRVNGLITPLRPMNLEGVNGKNPVYHVGKLYNVAARQIAQLLHERFGGYAEVHLVSATGQLLARPWQTLIRLSGSEVDTDEVQAIAREVFGRLPEVTGEIVWGEELLA